MAFDIIDARILEALQENARISISGLSKKINLSLSAISERLKKLENSGIINQYTAILNPKAMHRSLQAIMMVGVDGSGDMRELVKLVESSDEILECHFIAGTCDYILKIYTENTDTLAALVVKIKGIKGVKTTETNVFLNTIKNKYSVSPTALK